MCMCVFSTLHVVGPITKQYPSSLKSQDHTDISLESSYVAMDTFIQTLMFSCSKVFQDFPTPFLHTVGIILQVYTEQKWAINNQTNRKAYNKNIFGWNMFTDHLQQIAYL